MTEQPEQTAVAILELWTVVQKLLGRKPGRVIVSTSELEETLALARVGAFHRQALDGDLTALVFEGYRRPEGAE